MSPFDRPASASLSRVLAPESPSWPTSLLPYLLAAAAMIWAGRRVARRADASDDTQLMLFVAALLACVVTSPTGWVMGFVWALPIAPLVFRVRATASAPRWWLRAVVGAWIVCALPAPMVGWPAMAGAALTVAAGADGHRVAARMIVLAASLLALAVAGVALARVAAAAGESRATTATRAGLAAAAVMVGVQAVLGAVGMLTAVHTLIALALLAAGAALWARRRPRQAPRPGEPWSAADAALAAALLALFAERLWHGLHATTFLYDTLSYHLHMPATWMHEARLAIVPAVFGDPSPAYAPANLELWFLLLMAPLRSDYLAGIGQLPLAALAATAIVAAVREAGGGRTAALAAALAFLLVPEVHGQTATAMTDLGLAAFLLASLPFALRRDVVWIAAALGLASGPNTWASCWRCRSPPPASCSRCAAARPVPGRDALVALAVLIATGGFWYLRNVALTGNPLYPVAVPGLPLPARYGGAEMRAWEYHLPVADVAALGELLLGAGIAFASAAGIALARARRGPELALVAALVAAFWLVVPYQESRFLFAAFGVAAVALGRTARQPPAASGGACWVWRSPVDCCNCPRRARCRWSWPRCWQALRTLWRWPRLAGACRRRHCRGRGRGAGDRAGCRPRRLPGAATRLQRR